MDSVPSVFWTWINKFNGDDLAGLTAGTLVVFAAVVGMICLTVYKIHKTRADHSLKRELLDRGLSADEIATIVRAAPPAVLPRGWKKDG